MVKQRRRLLVFSIQRLREWHRLCVLMVDLSEHVSAASFPAVCMKLAMVTNQAQRLEFSERRSALCIQKYGV